MTLSLVKPDSASWVVDTINTIVELINSASKSSYNYSTQQGLPGVVRAVDGKDGTVRVIIETKAKHEKPPRSLMDFLNAAQGFHAGMSFGWSWETLMKDQLTIKTLDLANIELFVSADKVGCVERTEIEVLKKLLFGLGWEIAVVCTVRCSTLLV